MGGILVSIFNERMQIKWLTKYLYLYNVRQLIFFRDKNGDDRTQGGGIFTSILGTVGRNAG
jgi:hypothetical protein